jgi:PLP dependent protein
MHDKIAHNVAAVRQEIAAACARAQRDPASVRLIAVTKQQTPAVLPYVQEQGVTTFGENRLDHLELMAQSAPAGSEFHYIGRVQSRQLAKIIPYCSALHSLCEAEHIERLGKACAAAHKKMQVFLQVNCENDPAKAGMMPEQLPERLALARAQSQLDVVGLMTMAPIAEDGAQVDDQIIRRCFATLRQLAKHHDLPRLSMGMSHDFQLAVEEGATDVRIGTRLFI